MDWSTPQRRSHSEPSSLSQHFLQFVMKTIFWIYSSCFDKLSGPCSCDWLSSHRIWCAQRSSFQHSVFCFHLSGHDSSTVAMINRTFINVSRQVFSTAHHKRCTTLWNISKYVAQRRYDDLIKAYYEGLTVLIKDLGSHPPAFASHRRQLQRSMSRKLLHQLGAINLIMLFLKDRRENPGHSPW